MASNFQEFKSIVVVSPFADGKFWYLRSPLNWLSSDGVTITVPEGFVTDFATIPRYLWMILPKWEKYGPAAVVHDYLYWEQKYNGEVITRKKADNYMLEAMRDCGVSCCKRKVIHKVLRLLGGFAWCGNRHRKSAGGISQIPFKIIPTPRETWKQCQERIKKE